MLFARLGCILLPTIRNVGRSPLIIRAFPKFAISGHPAARLQLIARTMTSSSTGLEGFLTSSKDQYSNTVKEGKGADWVVVMGNEAGDLDSLVSAIALGWYKNVIQKEKAVTLVQTSRSDLSLRAENLHALQLANLADPTRYLLCIDDIPQSTTFPSYRFALVDHNRLQTRFTLDNPNARVEAIIDHHEDEGVHQDTAEPRIVVTPTGSCASLVARFLDDKSVDAVPKELATLLLCAILVDTNGLKPGGKAEPLDREAAAYLLPHSLLPDSGSFDPAALHDHPQLKELSRTLQDKKGDVSHLGTRDLLRRDYKEYNFVPSWTTGKTITVGLSTIPIGLHPWISNDKDFWSAAEGYMSERQLSVLGLLTSFRDDKKINKHGKPKHRREQLYVVRNGDVDELPDRLFKGLKHAEELELKKRSLKDDYLSEVPAQFGGNYHIKVWEQGNADATRKVTAPLVKRIIEG